MATCNMCGESCQLLDKSGADCGESGLIDCEVVGGYFSTPGNGYGALDDCTSYTFSLCEFCLDWLFNQFKIPPGTFDMIDGKEEKWELSISRVMNEDWRKQKESFLQEYTRRSVLRGNERMKK